MNKHIGLIAVLALAVGFAAAPAKAADSNYNNGVITATINQGVSLGSVNNLPAQVDTAIANATSTAGKATAGATGAAIGASVSADQTSVNGGSWQNFLNGNYNVGQTVNVAAQDSYGKAVATSTKEAANATAAAVDVGATVSISQALNYANP